MAAISHFYRFSGAVYGAAPHLLEINGLAGVVFLLTVLIVLSGVVGRYIYTAVPRSADGIALEAIELERQIAEIEKNLIHWNAAHPEAMRAISPNLDAAFETDPASSAFWGRALTDSWYRLRWWYQTRRLDANLRQQAETLSRLLRHRRVLHRQVHL